MKIREYGIVEDDLPLRGPWTRREDSPRPAQSRPAEYTEGRETAGKGESVEDSPLRGPWSPRQEEPVPREVDLPRAGKERRRVEHKPGGGPRTVSVEEACRPSVEGAVIAPYVPEVREMPEVPDARDSCPAGRRRRLMPDLLTPKGIYQGFIMAEILGSRGGRSRRRPN